MIATEYKVFAEDEGLILRSGPGRDLIFKVTGDDTGGALDYFIVQVAPKMDLPCMFTISRRRLFMS